MLQPFSPNHFVKMVVVIYQWKYVHLVLGNHLGGLSLPGISVCRLIDWLNMTIIGWLVCKTTVQTSKYPLSGAIYLLR